MKCFGKSVRSTARCCNRLLVCNNAVLGLASFPLVDREPSYVNDVVSNRMLLHVICNLEDSPLKY